MCVVSMIGGQYEEWFKKAPYQPWTTPPQYPSNDYLQGQINHLRKQVEEMKELLKKALEYDKKNHEPHCENDVKIAFLKKVAESVGLTLDDIFPGSHIEPTPPPSRLIKESKTPKKPKKLKK